MRRRVLKSSRLRAPNSPPFKQRDVARALRSARAAGATKARVEIMPSGVIAMDVELVASAINGEDNRNNPWDEVLTNAAHKERAP